MLETLKEIFRLGTIETNSNGDRVELNSHTKELQGLFLQKVFDKVQPKKSLEVGLALGISTLFILEKHKQLDAADKCHIIIEPFSWGDAAIHNIRKEGLEKYVDIRNDFSHVVIPSLFLDKQRIQFAYVDTTKVFDTVLHDFYFIDKILDVGGVVVFDDATMGGISVVIRFVNSLPHYEILDKYEKTDVSVAFKIGRFLFQKAISLIPFKEKYLPFYSLKTSSQLGLDYNAIAFRKTAEDSRKWDWDRPF